PDRGAATGEARPGGGANRGRHRWPGRGRPGRRRRHGPATSRRPGGSCFATTRDQTACGEQGATPQATRGQMNPSRLFILRPVATTLLMVAILLAGVFAYRLLPISALPQVDYPTIQTFTFYPGASPEAMASSVTAPPQRQFGQIPGVKQMLSPSSRGAPVITLPFDLTLPPHVAQQGGQAAIHAGL